MKERWNLNGIVSGIGLENFGKVIVSRLNTEVQGKQFEGRIDNQIWGGYYVVSVRGLFGRRKDIMSFHPQSIHLDGRGTYQVSRYLPKIIRYREEYVKIVDQVIRELSGSEEHEN